MPNDHYYYITVAGDTFDIIALAFYGDEHFSSRIMQANPEYVKVIVFPEGVNLRVPVIDTMTASTLPPWKR